MLIAPELTFPKSVQESAGEKSLAVGESLTAEKMEQCRWVKPKRGDYATLLYGRFSTSLLPLINGLCVITMRLPVVDIADHERTSVLRRDLQMWRRWPRG